MVIAADLQLPRYQRDVDGLVLPVPVATHPALDFCNTLAGWSSDEPHEYLETYAHLAVWAREAGLVDARATATILADAKLEPRRASRELERARNLRRALYRACTDPADRVAWEAVASEARAAARHAVLNRDEPPGRRWSVSADVGLARPVLELGREAGELIATTDLRHLKACMGTDCGWLFLDPGDRRRWCTMEVCGNRAKARRHAQRARSARAGRWAAA
jgi:predicted RNA-binding Zn ribbon-like protein